MTYKRKQQKKFYDSREAILWTLHDLAFAATHGHIEHNKLIRLGEKTNNLVAQHGHLVERIQGKIGHPLWPTPREGFPKLKKSTTER